MEDQAFELDDATVTVPTPEGAEFNDPQGLVDGAGAPGPSGIEMPGSGCWTFDLRWAGRSDRLRLAYRSDDPG
jgi:hypothetical protein